MHKTTSANEIDLSERVKIKRKAFHKFDTNISEVYRLLGETDSVNRPKIYVISPNEMTSNAVASYQPIENILNINSVLFNTDSLKELQKDFARNLLLQFAILFRFKNNRNSYEQVCKK